MSYLYKFLVAGSVLVLGAMLLATIYFTLFDLQWIAFLTGILFAAVAAMATQTAKAQWLVVRRTRQLERTKTLLTKESAQRERSDKGLETMEARFRSVGDALSAMLLFIDRDERCRYHNSAFRHWCGRTFDAIDGSPLHAVVSDEVYQDLKAHSADALAGKEIHYAAAWARPDGGRENLNITLLPYPLGMEKPSGFYALIERTTGTFAAPEAKHDDAFGKAAAAQESGETVYLDSMAEQFSGSDPRTQLMRALREDEFILYAQTIEPVVPEADSPRCLEILLRLQEEERQMLPPGGFFPAAEHYGLMGEIDRWVVRNLLKWCADRRLGDRNWRMPLYCVNLSSAGLSDSGFPRYVQNELDRYDIPGNSLCFEIAEPDVINYRGDVQAVMAMLKPLGCRFTADAFGSVRVSFAPFNDLRFDFVKIDGVIIQNILREPSDLAKTRAIVLACRKIGVRTIAEFVESEEMLATLRGIGVDYVQGFGIGKPAPLAQLS